MREQITAIIKDQGLFVGGKNGKTNRIIDLIYGEIEKGLLSDKELTEVLPDFPLYLPSRQSDVRKVAITQLDKILSLLRPKDNVVGVAEL
jgi:hypothetical protein